MTISRQALFGKLNLPLFRGIESATAFAKRRGNPYVELTHWIHPFWQLHDSDLHRVCRHYRVEAVAGSPEDREGPRDGSRLSSAMPGEASGVIADSPDGKSALARCCTDLTERARGGQIDPVIGQAEHELSAHEARWLEELAMVQQIHALRTRRRERRVGVAPRANGPRRDGRPSMSRWLQPSSRMGRGFPWAAG